MWTPVRLREVTRFEVDGQERLEKFDGKLQPRTLAKEILEHV